MAKVVINQSLHRKCPGKVATSGGLPEEFGGPNRMYKRLAVRIPTRGPCDKRVENARHHWKLRLIDLGEHAPGRFRSPLGIGEPQPIQTIDQIV